MKLKAGDQIIHRQSKREMTVIAEERKLVNGTDVVSCEWSEPNGEKRKHMFVVSQLELKELEA